MKFTINKNEFLKALLQVGKIIPLKSPRPINTNIKIVLTTNSLELTGSNDDLAITTTIPFFKNDKEIIRDVRQGEILVSNYIITEIAKKIDGEELTFEVLDDNIARIKNDRSDFKLNCIDANDYPNLDFSTLNSVKIKLNTKEFVDGIQHVAFAASNKNNRLILTGINIKGNGEKISITATDGYRLAKKDFPLESEKFSITIPSKAMTEILRSIDSEESITININDRKAIFEIGDTLISTKLLNGDFPLTDGIIPKNFYYVLEANSNDLISALERVNIFNINNNNDGNIVKLVMSENNVIFTCKSAQDGTSQDNLTLYKYTGDRLEINLNSDFLIDAIRSLKSEDVIISFLGEMKPFSVSCKDEPSIIHLITPVRS